MTVCSFCGLVKDTFVSASEATTEGNSLYVKISNDIRLIRKLNPCNSHLFEKGKLINTFQQQRELQKTKGIFWHQGGFGAGIGYDIWLPL